MAENLTGADKEPYQRNFLCPLCEASQSSIGHLTEHLKKVHRPLAELGPFSKRDDRLRLSPQQKEELAKTVPKHRHKSTEYKYSLIRNIVAPESPMPADNVTHPSVKLSAHVPQSYNLQEYFGGHTETTLSMFRVLGENEKEAVIQYFEDLVHTLRVAAANAKGATRTGSPHHPVPVLTVTRPTFAYPFPILDPPIPGLVVFEASFCPPNSSNQSFMALGPAVKRQSPEWSGDSVLDPQLFEQEDEEPRG